MTASFIAYRRELRTAHRRPQPLVVPSPQPCRSVDPEIFFPRPGHTGTAAKRVCAACTTRETCLEQALDTHQQRGIWGGTTPKERRALGRGRAERTVDAWLAVQAVAA